MRKRILGTIAVIAAGAGAAFGQTPVPPPTPIAPVGATFSDQSRLPLVGYADPIPPGGIPPMAAGFDPAAAGGPGYPAGLHGQPSWAPPSGASKDDIALHSRIAPRIWGDFDYLLWFSRAQRTQFPYVTTGAPTTNGTLGTTGTIIQSGRTDLGYNALSGFRGTIGFYKDLDRRYGYYFSGFFVEPASNVYRAASDPTGQPLIARPFINAPANAQDVLLVSFPTFASGSITVEARTSVWGAEGGPFVNLFRSCPEDCWLWDVNLMTGFRFLQLDESLQIRQRTSVLQGNTVPFDGKLYGFPATVGVRDQIETTNNFYGGNVGLNTKVQYAKWSLGLGTKIALGVMHQQIDVIGFSTLTNGINNITSTVPGGLYANAMNIGRYKRDEFAVIPEITGTVGYAWTSWFSTTVGYNFLYMSRVARPTEQYTPFINPSTIPLSPAFGVGPVVPVPNPLLTQSEYWMHGVNFGLNIRY